MDNSATRQPGWRKEAKNFWIYLLLSGVAAQMPLHAVGAEAPAAPDIGSGSPNLLAQATDTAFTSDNGLVGADMPSVTDIAQPANTNADINLSQGVDGGSMDRINSVNRLSDVRPTDWAFSALQSLAERYNCLLAYPDNTYRGNRALTRYEFAAGLNACLESIQQLITSATAEIGQSDLDQIKRLQEEFGAELATLRARVDGLEVRTGELEANQFSATTKLYSFAWFNVNAGFNGEGVQRERINAFAPNIRDSRFIQTLDGPPNATTNGLVWFDFVTSFSGKDQLVTQLAFGNAGGPPDNPLGNAYVSDGLEFTYGTDFTTQGGGVNRNDVTLRELYYQFPIGDKVQVVVGPRFNYFRFLEGNQFSFLFTGGPIIFNFFSFNSANSTQVNAIDRGGGALVMMNLHPKVKLNLVYMGESDEYLPSSLFNSVSNPEDGLFSPTNTAAAELTLKPTDNSNIRFSYTRTGIKAINGVIGFGINEPMTGFADDGFGGRVGDATADTFAVNADWLLTPGLGIFGRYSYGSTNIFAKTPGRDDGEVNIQSYQVGLAFPNLGKQGSMGMLSFLVPYDILDGEEFLITGAGDGGKQYEFEASYFLPVSKNIAIVPSLFVIGNPNNFDDNPTIYIGNFRTQFNF